MWDDMYYKAKRLIGTMPSGFVPFIVGGAARDWALAKKPRDIDIEIFAAPPQEIMAWASRVDPDVILVGKAYEVITLRFEGDKFDVSSPRRERKVGVGHSNFEAEADPNMSLDEAALRRDLTMNAMFLSPHPHFHILDPLGGLKDMRENTLVPTGPRFKEDPDRVMRAARFIGTAGYAASPDLVQYARDLKGEAQYLPPSRVWGEMYKMMSEGDYPDFGMRFLHTVGWGGFFPHFDPMWETEQDAWFHPEGFVWNHTELVMERVVEYVRSNQFDDDTRAVLVFAALCHDMGKAVATTYGTVDRRIHSYRHEQYSEEMAREFMATIGAPIVFQDRVATLCKHHMKRYTEPTITSIGKLARDLAPYATVREWAALAWADINGRDSRAYKIGTPTKLILKLAEQIGLSDQAPAPLIMGRDLIALGLRPGPAFGDILRAAMEAQLEGEFDEETKDIWIRSYLIHEKGMKL
jgi:tRNA nucleotidyltransferase (CCA-adding enzyme)